MEPGTFEWLTRKYKSSYPYLIGRRVEELEYNIDLAILMARLRYRVVPEPLPDPNDVQALARYWKLHYNTIEGRGTEREFMENYHKYIGAI